AARGRSPVRATADRARSRTCAGASRGGERELRADAAVDVRAQPQLELHQRPDLRRVVARAGDVVVDHAAHRLLAEEAALQRARIEQDLAREVAQRPAEPLADR